MRYEYIYEACEPLELHPGLADKYQIGAPHGIGTPRSVYGEICMAFLERMSHGGAIISGGARYCLGALERVIVEGGYGIGYPVVRNGAAVEGMDKTVGIFFDLLAEEYAKQYPELIEEKACGSENYKKFLERENPLCVFVPLDHLERHSGMVYVKAVRL